MKIGLPKGKRKMGKELDRRRYEEKDLHNLVTLKSASEAISAIGRFARKNRGCQIKISKEDIGEMTVDETVWGTIEGMRIGAGRELNEAGFDDLVEEITEEFRE